MKVELSGEEKAVIAVYLNSFEEHYKSKNNKHLAKKFRKVKEKFLLNSDKTDAKIGDWSFIIKTLLEGKRLIVQNLPEVEKIEKEDEKEETKKSMEHAMTNINSALKKIQERI